MSSGPLRLSGPSTFCCCVTRGAARPLAEHKVISLALTRIIAPLVKTCHLSAHLHEGNLRRAPVTSHPVPACLSKQPALPKQTRPNPKPNPKPPRNPPDPTEQAPPPKSPRPLRRLPPPRPAAPFRRAASGTWWRRGGTHRHRDPRDGRGQFPMEKCWVWVRGTGT